MSRIEDNAKLTVDFYDYKELIKDHEARIVREAEWLNFWDKLQAMLDSPEEAKSRYDSQNWWLEPIDTTPPTLHLRTKDETLNRVQALMWFMNRHWQEYQPSPKSDD